MLAIGGQGGTFTVIETASARIIATRSAHTEPIRSLDWSPDGQRMLTASDDGVLRLWSADHIDLVATFTDEIGPAAGWSADGSRLAAGYRKRRG